MYVDVRCTLNRACARMCVYVYAYVRACVHGDCAMLQALWCVSCRETLPAYELYTLYARVCPLCVHTSTPMGVHS